MCAEPPHETVTVELPPAHLQAAFTCAVLRSVAGDSGDATLAGWVHANPYACLNVVSGGCVAVGHRTLPTAFLVGPLSQPLRTTASAPLRSLSLVFQPWLLQPLFGIAARELVDHIVEAAEVRSPVLQAWCAEAMRALDATPGLGTFWQDLAHGMPRQWPAPPALALDVLREQGVAAAAATVACSTRQYRRRFERHLGLNPAAWLRVARWEQALREMASAGAATGLGQVAAGAGYADQAHMTRETRAFTGESPRQLRSALRRGDANWSVRPAGVRSVQDAE